jgi:hypothetical protein
VCLFQAPVNRTEGNFVSVETERRKCQGRTVLWNALTAERVANKAA